MLEITNGAGAQTLDIVQNNWADEGYGVSGDVSSPDSGPLAVTVNTGTLGNGNNTLSVASGDALVGGSTVTLGSSTSVDIEAASSQPRKDLVWIDSGGNLQVEKGTPTQKKPSGFSRFETYYPAIPFPSTTPAACLAAVYVPANTTAISSPDIQDRRLTSETIRSLVSTEELSIDQQSVRIYQSADQSIPNSSPTTVAFDSEETDHTPGDVLTVDLANDKITLEKNGTYLIVVSVAFDSPGDGTRIQSTINQDGGTIKRSATTTGANDITHSEISTIYEESNAPSDITQGVFQNSGSSIDTFSGANDVTLEIVRLG